MALVLIVCREFRENSTSLVFESLRGTNNWKRPDRNQQHSPRPSGEGTGRSFHDLNTSVNCFANIKPLDAYSGAMGVQAQIAGLKAPASLFTHDLSMSLNCLNVLPLAIGHRLSRMAVKGFGWKACRLGIDTFDAPLLSKWVQHIGACGRTPNPSIAGSNPATYARLDRTI